jgi:hypothetical protein
MPLAPSVAAALFEGTADEIIGSGSGTPFSLDGKRDYTVEVRIRVKDKTIGPIIVCMAPGVPVPFAPYIRSSGAEYDLNAFLIRLSARRELPDDWTNWIATCNYSTDVGNGIFDYGGADTQNGAANNPDLEPPSVDWDFEEQQVAWARDLKGQAFTNSARQPFSPPPMFPESYPVLTFSRNELFYNRETATKFAYALNSTPFLGAQKGCAQLLPPRASLQYRGKISFYRVTYRIRFRDPNVHQFQDWQPHILDAGTMELQDKPGAPRGGQPVPICGPNGQAITQPVLLDGKGKRAKEENGQRWDGNAWVQEKVIKPRFRDFFVYQYQDLNQLLQRGLGAILG